MLCAICHTRKPKRDCPGVHGAICTICCATGREETVDCPLTCEYLRDAHRHEHPRPAAPIPNLDIELTDEFVEQNEFLLLMLSVPLAKLIEREPSITDYDAREAFEALVQTWKTLRSGLVFEQTPANPYAAMICQALRDELESLRERAGEDNATITDAQALGVFAMMQRFEHAANNGRRRSRAFLDAITAPYRGREQESSLALEPEEPRIIL